MSTGAAIGLVCVILAAALVYLLAISWADDGPGGKGPGQPECSKPHKLHVEDLVAIERAGITLGIEVAYTRARP